MKLEQPFAAPSHDGEPFTPALISTLREGYGLADFRIDAIAGLTVAIVALPLSLAIAIASDLSPDKGLIAAIVGGFIIAVLGGSRYQIGGPAGAFVVLISLIVERHGSDGLVLATFMAGLMMILIGVLRLGRLIRHVPPAVLVGFTAGIAIIIFASQMRELLGLDLIKEPTALLPKLIAIGGALATAKPMTMAVAALSLAAILVIRRIRPRWPAFLIVVVLSALLTGLVGFDVATIGSRFGGIPQSLPAPALPDFSLAKLLAVLPDALAVALLGTLESLLSALVADGMSGRHHRPDIELVAQGVANMAVMCFGGMCVTGTIARTATNIRAGAKSPVSGLLHAAYLLLFMLLAAPLASHIPLAALGAVLVIVCWGMVEKQAIRHLLTTGKSAAAVLLTTFLLVILVDLMLGIAVGTILGLVLQWKHRNSAAPAP